MKTFEKFIENLQNNQYGYRGVNNYEKVKHNGLKPNFRHKGKLLLYFAINEDEASKYGNIILRFPLPKFEHDPMFNPYYKVTESSIPVNDIWVKLDATGEFTPILKTRMIRNFIEELPTL